MCNGENDQKKRYLMRFAEAKIAEKELSEQLEELEGRYIMPSKVLDDMPKGSNTSDLSNFAAQYDAVYRKLINAYTRTVTVQREIMDAIDAMPTGEAQKTLLRYRYLHGKKWEEIAVIMGYTYQWVCVLHGRALQAFRIPQKS